MKLRLAAFEIPEFNKSFVGSSLFCGDILFIVLRSDS
jgi:hypothetical protein